MIADQPARFREHAGLARDNPERLARRLIFAALSMGAGRRKAEPGVVVRMTENDDRGETRLPAAFQSRALAAVPRSHRRQTSRGALPSLFFRCTDTLCQNQPTITPMASTMMSSSERGM